MVLFGEGRLVICGGQLWVHPSSWKRSVRCSHPAVQPCICELANPPSPAPSGSAGRARLCTRCPQPLRVSRLRPGEKWPRGAARGCRDRDTMGAHVCMAAARSGAGRGDGGVGNRSPALPGDHGGCVCVCVCTRVCLHTRARSPWVLGVPGEQQRVPAGSQHKAFCSHPRARHPPDTQRSCLTWRRGIYSV